MDEATGLSEWVDRIFLYDGGGHVRALTDLEGNITDTFSYDAYGNLLGYSLSAIGDCPTFYLYRGERWDPDLGQYYLRARFYDANLGRFHTLDEYEGRTGEPLSLHKYLYAHANPVSGWDPSGMMLYLETQMGKMIQANMNKMSTVNMRFVMKKSGCWVVKLGLEKGIQSGIYVFLDANFGGGLYTGQSVNIDTRLIQHARRVVQPLFKISAKVSPAVLRQLEQTVFEIIKEIAADSGTKTTNRINPLREKLRKQLSNAMPLCK